MKNKLLVLALILNSFFAQESFAVPEGKDFIDLNELDAFPPAISLALGFSLPILADISIHGQTVANLAFPEGEFFDVEGQPRNWHLTLWQAQGQYYYKNLNLKTGRKLFLIGAKASGTKARPVFTWTNKKYKYRVSWQIVQPELIRLEVIDPSNKVIVNQFLVREPGEFEDPNATKC